MDAIDIPENQSQTWHVGLTYTTEFSKNFNYSQPTAWTSKTSNLTIISAPSESGWYIFNIQFIGNFCIYVSIRNFKCKGLLLVNIKI